jgi:hypothetical protein
MGKGMGQHPVPSPMENVCQPRKRPTQMPLSEMTGMILPMIKRSGHKDPRPAALTIRIRERDQNPENEIP